MKKVRVIKNFALKEEIDALNKWSLKNLKENPDQYMDANMDYDDPGSRVTTRLKNEDDHVDENVFINYPKVAYNIQDRIRAKFELWNQDHPPSFVDGIVNGIGVRDGYICKHIDPVYIPNTHTVHCNIISQKPDSGGVTIIEGKEYDIDPGDLLCYAVSEVYHEVTMTRGSTNRIIWVFGFCVSSIKMEEMFWYD
tara:strand:+ start:9086 stop:9670 length:585 start_codon:yes stop_codon:yes gene_type:complete